MTEGTREVARIFAQTASNLQRAIKAATPSVAKRVRDSQIDVARKAKHSVSRG
jgi:hypothetical protein